ncbi:MAG: CoA-binding protein [Nitrosopumilus sp.]|nr:CoA-binding protein [Nitrosopumilus sp.]
MSERKTDNFSDKEIREIYKLKNIAIVGVSPTEGKPSNYVSKYLIEKGYNVTPINPNYSEILDRKAYGNVSEVPDSIDIVDIFRRSEDVSKVVEDSIGNREIKVIWMQKGIYNKEAEKVATEKGIKVVYNRCMLEEHKRLFK